MVITAPHFFSSAPRGADFFLCRSFLSNDRIFSSKRPHVSPQTSARFNPNTAMYFWCLPSLTSYLLPFTSHLTRCSIAPTSTRDGHRHRSPSNRNRPMSWGSLHTGHKHIQHTALLAVLFLLPIPPLPLIQHTIELAAPIRPDITFPSRPSALCSWLSFSAFVSPLPILAFVE